MEFLTRRLGIRRRLEATGRRMHVCSEPERPRCEHEILDGAAQANMHFAPEPIEGAKVAARSAQTAMALADTANSQDCASCGPAANIAARSVSGCRRARCRAIRPRAQRPGRLH